MGMVPSLTFQLEILPSVIVGDIAGIVKFCAAHSRLPWCISGVQSVYNPLCVWEDSLLTPLSFIFLFDKRIAARNDGSTEAMLGDKAI